MTLTVIAIYFLSTLDKFAPVVGSSSIPNGVIFLGRVYAGFPRSYTTKPCFTSFVSSFRVIFFLQNISSLRLYYSNNHSTYIGIVFNFFNNINTIMNVAFLINEL